MSGNRHIIPFSGKKALAVAIAAAVLVAAAFYATVSTNGGHVSDPAVLSDLKQARKFGKSGDWAQSAQLIAPHARGRNPQAKLEYALLQSRGWGVARNREQARQLLLQAVAYDFAGRGRAAFELGRLYKTASGEDCIRIALEWFLKAAQWNYTKAHLELGAAYRKGLGTDPDLQEALSHYRIAAANGSATAIWSMIEMVRTGTGDSEPNLPMARSLAREHMPRLIEQARSGNAYAARTIARFHFDGRVVPHDREKAGRWFREAAGLGDPAAMHDLAQMLMKEPQESDTGRAILDLMRESARRGYAGAMTAMGRLHLKQRFGLSRADAVDWFRQGVAAGHGGSMEELARLYMVGDLLEPNLGEARRLATMGAKLHHKGSRRLLFEIDTKSGGAAQSADADHSSKRG